LTGAEAALALFDGGAPVEPGEILGRWRGSTHPTGHPLDGLLEAYGWYGKDFIDVETVHPLLFVDRFGLPRPVDPAYAPLWLLRRYPGLARTRAARAAFAGVRPLRYTRRAGGRLRPVEHRGVVTAAMIYDALPIVDVFRRLDGDTLLGLTDVRGFPQPFFFLLERDLDREGPGQPSR
jgi:hypothetical protein